jgi:hypothetical protein
VPSCTLHPPTPHKRVWNVHAPKTMTSSSVNASTLSSAIGVHARAAEHAQCVVVVAAVDGDRQMHGTARGQWEVAHVRRVGRWRVRVDLVSRATRCLFLHSLTAAHTLNRVRALHLLHLRICRPARGGCCVFVSAIVKEHREGERGEGRETGPDRWDYWESRARRRGGTCSRVALHGWAR